MPDDQTPLISTPRQIGLFAAVTVVSLLPAAMYLLGVTLRTGVGDYRDQLFEALGGEVASISYGLVQGTTAYSMLEWSLVILGMATAVLAYAHFHTKHSVISLIVSVGAFWTGAIHGFQLLAFHGFSIQVLDPAAFIQFNWTIAQGFTAVLILAAAGIVVWRGNDREQFSAGQLIAVIVGASALAYLIIFWTARINQFPTVTRPDALLSRPLDLVPLALFVLAATVVLPALHRFCENIFTMALWLSAVPLIFSQLYMGIWSGQVFDGGFTWAQLTKGLAFSIIFGGLVFDYARACRTEEHLRERLSITRRRFRMFFEHSDEAVVVFDADGRIQDWNPRATEMFGWTADEACQRDVTEVLFSDIEGDDRECAREFRERIRAFAEDGEEESLRQLREVVVTPPDGRERTILYTTVPALERGVPVFGLMARDVSERKKMQMRMFQMDRLVAAGTLAAGVVHEIKNPMTYVTSNLSLARETLDDAGNELAELATRVDPDDELADPVESLDQTTDDIEEMLDSSKEGCQRVRRLVDDMRVFSRTGEVETRPISVCDAVRIALRMTRGHVRRHAEIETEFGDVPPVDGDETRLSQVFVNIIVNAAQAMEQAPADDHRLYVQCRTEGRRAVVRIRDTGPGMSSSLQSKIFQPFFTTKSPGEGTGLGLPLSKSIIDKFDGDIEVDSTPGEGTTFEIRLPFSEQADQSSGDVAPSETD